MAEAAAIIGIINGAAGLVIKCAQVAQYLHDLHGKYKKADLALKTFLQNVESIQHAWENVRIWCEDSKNDAVTDDKRLDLLGQLDRSIECGDLVISALADDLESFVSARKASRLNFRQRADFVWNEAIIEAHRGRLRDQIATVQLLLQILSLPTSVKRSQLIAESERRVVEFSESVLSIIPSTSSLRSTQSDTSSIRSADLRYKPFGFEDSLFTARVYKRNYQFQSGRARPGLSTQKSTEGGMNVNGTLSNSNGLITGSEEANESISESPIEGDATSIATVRPNTLRGGYKASFLHSKRLYDSRVFGNVHPIAFVAACKNDDVEYIRQNVPWLPSTGGRRIGESEQSIRIWASFYLCTAAQHSINILRLLLEMGWAKYINDPIENESSALDAAILFDKEKAVSLLLEHNAGFYKETLQCSQVNNQLIQSSHMVLQHFIHEWACAKGSRPGNLMSYGIAAWGSRLNDVIRLIKEGGRSSVDKLLWNTELFHFLKDYVKHTKTKSPIIQDPIDYAIFKEDVSILKVFRSWNIDFSRQNGCGQSLIHYAVECNCKLSLDFLLGCNLPIDWEDRNGRQPIHEAAIWDRADMMKTLMAAGASLSCRDVWGRQPMHYAAKANNTDTLSFMVQNGVFFTEEDNQGYTPAHLAIGSGSPEVLFLISDDDCRRQPDFLRKLLDFAKAQKKNRAKILLEEMIRTRDENKRTKAGLSPMNRVEDSVIQMTPDED